MGYTEAVDWTQDRVNILTEMWKAGKLAKHIAIRLGTSDSTVRKKAHRLGLGHRAPVNPLWTKEEDQALMRLWGEGRSCQDIADVLGKNRNKVIGRRHRLKLTPREIAPRAPRKPPEPRVRKWVPKKPLPPVPVVDAPQGDGILIQDLVPESCREVIGRDKEGHPRYCGTKQWLRSYCMYHYDRNYVLGKKAA